MSRGNVSAGKPVRSKFCPRSVLLGRCWELWPSQRPTFVELREDIRSISDNLLPNGELAEVEE